MNVPEREKLDEALEAIAARTPVLATGERELQVFFSEGKVRRSYVKLGPMRADELNDLTDD